MIFSNVIFPAFSAPYISFILFPVASILAFVTEIIIFRKRYLGLATRQVVLTALLANIISWIAGVLLSSILPSGLVPKIVDEGEKKASIISAGPNFESLVFTAFAVAFLLSILIEYAVWRWIHREPKLPKLFVSTVLAHVGSYMVLIGIACIINILI